MKSVATVDLAPDDIALFDRFRVPVELLHEAGVRRVSNHDACAEYGFRFSGKLDGILFPYFTPAGDRVNSRIRRDHPDIENGKPKNKYVSAVYDHRRFYYPPNCQGWLADVSISVVIVESEKSVLAITALCRRTGRRLFLIGLGGAWGWKGRIGKSTAPDGARIDEKGPLPDFDHFTWTNRNVIICLDGNVDTNGQVHDAETALARELGRRGADVRCARIPQEPAVNGPDDFIAAHADEEFLELLDNAKESGLPRLQIVTIAELMAMQFPPREYIIEPILQTQGTAMLFSKRGVGKTHLSLGIGCAIAAGAKFLRWQAPKPRKVLYVDGEMPAVTMRERLAAIITGMDCDMDPAYFRLLTADLQPQGIPSLAGTVGQQLIEDYLHDAELLVLDNISTLCSGGKENEAESWLPIQEWILKLRRYGISVWFDHHAGKSGAQRGTSRREDVLDTVIVLRHPENYNPTEGLRCEVHFEKTRGLHGPAVEPFEVSMETHQGTAVWLVKDLRDVITSRGLELYNQGCSIRDVMKTLGVTKWKAEQIKKQREDHD